MPNGLRPTASRVRKHGGRPQTRPMTPEQEQELADRYAAALGWDKTPDQRAEDFKRATEGAPRVRRLASESRVG